VGALFVTEAAAAEIEAWIETCGAKLGPRDLEPASPIDAARVDALLARIDAARIVVLGELDHWIAEKSDFRLWWLSRLAARHRLVLAEELGHSDGRRVARYLDSGDETWLDRVPTFGWEGDRRPDRDDRPTGVLRASFDRYPTVRFKAAQCAFYREVRALGLRALHGIDVNGVAGAGYADVRERLTHLEPALARRVERGLTRVEGESALREAERLDRLRSEIAGHANLAEIDVDLEAMADSLRYQSMANTAPDYEGLRPAMAWREDMMKRAVDRLLGALVGDEKLVLMAHALHLAKDDDRLGSAAGVGPGGNIVHSLGHYLARERGEHVFAIWFVFGGGSDCQPFPDLPTALRYPPECLNTGLLAHGTPLLIDTASGAETALRTPVGVGHLYNLIANVDLAAQADAVFFLPTVSPLADAP
jgi:erythromycin esterase-like protein